MNAKPLYFLLPFLILLGTATTVAALETQRTPDWQTALNRYLAENAAQPAQVQTVAHADLPGQFTLELGSPVSDEWQWSIERLPFPPQELYCVLLQTPAAPGAAGESQAQVVYVGYLSDALYRTGWMVYAGPHHPFPAQLPLQLAAVGCDLPLAAR